MQGASVDGAHLFARISDDQQVLFHGSVFMYHTDGKSKKNNWFLFQYFLFMTILICPNFLDAQEHSHGREYEEYPKKAVEKKKSKLEKLGFDLAEPINLGLKLEFGGFLSDPKAVGGGIGLMGFLGSSHRLLIEGLVRGHYLFDAQYKTLFEVEGKVGYSFPLWSHTAALFAIGVGYSGFYPSTLPLIAGSQKAPVAVMPTLHYITLPLEAALMFDLSPSIDLEISPLLMPMFSIEDHSGMGGSVRFGGGLFMGFIFHPPKVVRHQDTLAKERGGSSAKP